MKSKDAEHENYKILLWLYVFDKFSLVVGMDEINCVSFNHFTNVQMTLYHLIINQFGYN